MTSRKNNDITAVILAGGKSVRMGTDKSLLMLSGKTLIERAISLCKKYFGRVLISTNNSKNYEFTGLECVADIHPSLGPISGIHSGLINSTTRKIFIYSADLIFNDERLLETMIKHSSEKQIILPTVDEIPQYTFGIYLKSVLPEIEKMILEREDYKPTPRQLIKKVEAVLIDFNKCIYFEGDKFINLNTPADYERAKLIFEKGNN
ncbi:MAG: molybdenum cofactor guanylyltransferase [Ignavibacteria bacterium]|nr:molybdenum cofactor guanylyltransferase [Ignavibacteria bacterium]